MAAEYDMQDRGIENHSLCSTQRYVTMEEAQLRVQAEYITYKGILLFALYGYG